MTLLELIHLLRERLDDMGGDTGTVPPGYSYYYEYEDNGCLWNNLILTHYLNGACNELALRSPIADSTSSEVAKINLTAGKAVYPIDPRILSIERVILDSTQEPLAKLSLAKEHNQWNDRDTTHSNPDPVTRYKEDFDEYSLTVYSTPVSSDILRLTVRRLPLDPLDWTQRTSQEIEFPSHQIDALIDWATMQAYLKRDADTYDKELAGYFQGQFTDRVGPRINFQHARIKKEVAGTRMRSRSYYY